MCTCVLSGSHQWFDLCIQCRLPHPHCDLNNFCFGTRQEQITKPRISLSSRFTAQPKMSTTGLEPKQQFEKFSYLLLLCLGERRARFCLVETNGVGCRSTPVGSIVDKRRSGLLLSVTSPFSWWRRSVAAVANRSVATNHHGIAATKQLLSLCTKTHTHRECEYDRIHHTHTIVHINTQRHTHTRGGFGDRWTYFGIAKGSVGSLEVGLDFIRVKVTRQDQFPHQFVECFEGGLSPHRLAARGTFRFLVAAALQMPTALLAKQVSAGMQGSCLDQQIHANGTRRVVQ